MADDAWFDDGGLEAGRADQDMFLADDGRDLIGRIQPVLERQQAARRAEHVPAASAAWSRS